MESKAGFFFVAQLGWVEPVPKYKVHVKIFQEHPLYFAVAKSSLSNKQLFCWKFHIDAAD